MSDKVSKVNIEKNVLSENDQLAAVIRSNLAKRRIVTLNLVSSPGSGKTSLLENTLAALKDRLNMALIAGDVQTENDAERLARAGGRIVRPIVTGGACHLDARMISKTLSELDLSGVDILFIENVGNLVCPSSYDLGEDMKVVLISTTEGDDKPIKYPTMFSVSDICLINKTDLLPYVDFDLEKCKKYALGVNHHLKFFEVSAKTGAGLTEWYDWLKAQMNR